MLLISMGDLPDGKYKVVMKPKENNDLIEGVAETIVTKYSIEDQQNETDKSDGRAAIYNIVTKVVYYTGIGAKFISDFTLKNLTANGFLLQFSMAIKFISRLRYINVQYGMALDEFFVQSDDISFMATGNDKDRINSRENQKNGKFSEYNTEIEIMRSIPFVLGFYIFLWLTKFLINGLVASLYTKKEASRLVYTFINIHSNIHLIFFTMALMDISFFGVRSLVHLSFSSGASFWTWMNFIVACISFIMLGIDIHRLASLYINLEVNTDL